MTLRRLLLAAFVAASLAALPAIVRAQSSAPVHAGAEVDTPPRLTNPTRTARLVADSYPSRLRRSGVSGQAQVQFVVDTSGKVEPESIEVVLASGPAFAIAAKRVAGKIHFTPGRSNGQVVRTRVLLPIAYK
ncbi:MAG: energy transducer TonB [Gemmatimonadota bacterium]